MPQNGSQEWVGVLAGTLGLRACGLSVSNSRVNPIRHKHNLTWQAAAKRLPDTNWMRVWDVVRYP